MERKALDSEMTRKSDTDIYGPLLNEEVANESGGELPAKYYPLFLVVGIVFGIFLLKSEVISWFRIQEMFRFQSFHMYGVIGSAVAVGMLSIFIIRKFKIKTIRGEKIALQSRKFSRGQIYGGLLFGFGWALTGACPGPVFAQIGSGFSVVIITLFSAILGTWTYGLIREKLPH